MEHVATITLFIIIINPAATGIPQYIQNIVFDALWYIKYNGTNTNILLKKKINGFEIIIPITGFISQ